MARLRHPERGCPWDLEQTFETIAVYTIEEAYEVADAIARGDMTDLRDELGDLLLQAVYHSHLADEKGLFDFDDVARTVTAKMIRRHPHVFGNGQIADAKTQHQAWEDAKRLERDRRAPDDTKNARILADLPVALPALSRALKMQKRVARVGFDWPDRTSVLAKIVLELAELMESVDQGQGADRVEDEMGDLLFSVANLARHLGIDPEVALSRCNRKFERRFNWVEETLREEGQVLEDAGLDRLEAYWLRAKDEA
ncbi:MAG: nucleoside triphosphate pyrophosphohydrolase [Geminicoccaceae bacterium]